MAGRLDEGAAAPQAVKVDGLKAQRELIGEGDSQNVR